MDQKKKSASGRFARECIVDALLVLTKEKPLSAITVSELCDHAGVSRMTFYRNYASKEEVFSSRLLELLEEYGKEETEDQRSGNYFDKNHMIHCFQYWFRYRDFFDSLIHCGFGNIFIEYLMRFILKKWSYETEQERLHLISFTGSIISLYIAWADGGYRESIEDLASVLDELYR